MSEILGHDAARASFAAALRGKLHHAWLITGPQGVGKASFAAETAVALLAGDTDPTSTRRLIAAGAHPDFRALTRLPKEGKEEGELARSVTIAQVRALLPMFATAPSLSSRRVVLIDAIDDLERGAANALLKSLEEPPAGTVFLLVSHAPGRLLPTIRSRCRLLRFGPLAADVMASVLRRELPETDAKELAALISAGEGSPGRALRFAGLELGTLDRALADIARNGDRSNARRVALSKDLSVKAAQPSYEAFLDRAPAFIGSAAATRSGSALRTALDAYHAARALAGAARGLSLDAAATAYEMAGLVARLAAD